LWRISLNLVLGERHYCYVRVMAWAVRASFVCDECWTLRQYFSTTS